MGYSRVDSGKVTYPGVIQNLILSTGTNLSITVNIFCFKNLEFSDEQCEETLNLGLEESFFLTYAIGCLLVKFDNNYLTIDDIWTLFRETSPDFLPRYVSYHVTIDPIDYS